MGGSVFWLPSGAPQTVSTDLQKAALWSSERRSELPNPETMLATGGGIPKHNEQRALTLVETLVRNLL